MALRLGAVAARRHVAPAAATRPRLVVEQPLAGVVGADPDPVVVAVADLAHDRLGDPGEDVIDRVAHVLRRGYALFIDYGGPTGAAAHGYRSHRVVHDLMDDPGSTDIKPLTPLIKQVKLVEDFERVLTWGAGLDHLACPKVTELAGPFRLVLDFPTPP